MMRKYRYLMFILFVLMIAVPYITVFFSAAGKKRCRIPMTR